MAKFPRLFVVLALCVIVMGLKAPPQYKGWLRFTQGEWSASPVNVPDFREFPAEKPTKKIARDIDFKSHKHARRYRTSLREGLKEGANYTGTIMS